MFLLMGALRCTLYVFTFYPSLNALRDFGLRVSLLQVFLSCHVRQGQMGQVV